MNLCARIVLSLAFATVAYNAHAGAAVTWTANGGTGVWTEAGNWNAGAGPVPGVGDTAIFNATGTSNCIVNRTSIGAIDIQAGYTGALSNLDDLKGYWPLDEAAGTVAADVSGFGNNGTYVGAPPIVAGAPTTFANPNARSLFVNQYVTNTSFTWPANSAVTVSFWSYTLSADVATTISSAFSVAPFNTDPTGNRLQAHVPWSDGILYWDYGDLSKPGCRVQVFYGNSTTPGYCNKWTHVALVSAGPGGNFQGIYLDGALVMSAASSQGLTTPNTGITIGALYPSWPHRGLLDDFRIYNRVLSVTEIAALASDSPVGGGLTMASTLNVGGAGVFNCQKPATFNGAVTVNGGTYLGAARTHTMNAGLTVSSGTFTGSTGTLNVLGTLLQSGGTFTAPTTLTFGGALFNHSGGTFTHNGGTVQFTGTNQTITGSTTFNNFSKTVTAPNSLTFGAGSTQTVGGTLTLRGSSTVNRLAIRSTVPGTRANIVPTGVRSVDFVDVQDSNNSTFPKIFPNVPANSLNSGNTIGWFNLAPTAAADSYATNQDTRLTIAAAAGVLFNDADTDAPPDAISASLAAAPANGLVTFNADGSFDYVPALGFSGTDSFTYQTTDRTVTLAPTTVTITVNQVFGTLTLSGPTANPNPATAGSSVEFTALANLGGASFVWNFGDGSVPRSGVQVNHIYATAGIYPVTVTVTHTPSSQSAVGSLNLTVNATGTGGGGTPGTPTVSDSDGDGFVDEIEIAAGSNPNSAAGTPYGLPKPGTPELLQIGKIAITLSFKRAGADSILLTGSLPVAAGFSPSGQRVLLSIGGIAKTFQLDGKGAAVDGNAVFKLKYNAKKGGNAKFGLQMKGGSYQSNLADENLTNSDVRSDRRVIKVHLLVDGKAYYREAEALYSAKLGNIGKTK